MKKPIRETEMQLQLRHISDKLEGIGDKLDDLSVLVHQQSELLRRLEPNETKTIPSEIVTTRKR